MEIKHSEIIEILDQIKKLKEKHDKGECKYSHCPCHSFFFKPDDIKFEGENMVLFNNLSYLEKHGYIKEQHISEIGEFGIMYTI